MKLAPTKISLSIATLGVALLAGTPAMAADTQPARSDTTPNATTLRNGMDYSDRARMKTWSDEKDQLERELRPGESLVFYTKALADRGFQITSVNSDKPGSAEYEVVKGDQTYEVQLDLDKAGKVTEVDVTTNMWRSDATKAAMRGEKVPVATRFAPGNENYSDRARMQGWSGEKDRLESALPTGHDKAYYAQQLKTMGYQVTSTNETKADYVEYEVVKGANTFEVQIDLANGVATEVDVTTNLWKSDATDRALSVASQR